MGGPPLRGGRVAPRSAGGGEWDGALIALPCPNAASVRVRSCVPETTEDRALTWATLLAHWTDFARSAVALPATPDGDRWKRAVAPIIGLQAVMHALAEFQRLAPEERPLALDRAEALIERHERELRTAWAEDPLDPGLEEIVRDARSAFAAATASGLEWIAGPAGLTAEHPGELVAGLQEADFRGDLLVPAPGVPLLPGSPAVFLAAPRAGPIDPVWVEIVRAWLAPEGGAARSVATPKPQAGPRQVYRQFDFGRGGPVRDLVRPLSADPAAGQPILLWAIKGGASQPVPLPPRRPEPAPEIPLEFAGA